MKKIVICIGMICTGLMSIAQNSDTLTLQQCIENGIKNNLGVRQQELQMERSKVNLSQSKSNFLPVVFGDATHGINSGRSIDPYTNSYINQQVNYATYGVNGSLVLFHGFGELNGLKQNSLEYNAQQLDFQQSKDNLAISIVIAYLQALTQNDLKDLAVSQIMVTEKQVSRLEELNRQGATSPSLLYDLKGQLAGEKLSMINAQNTLDQSKLDLSQLMNIPYSGKLELQPLSAEEFSSVYSASPAEIYDAAQQLPLVKASGLHLKSSEKTLAAARSDFYPLISLNAGLNTNYSNAAFQNILQNTEAVTTSDYVEVNGSQIPVITEQQTFLSERIPYRDQLNNNLNSSVSLSLSIPIFNSFSARHQVQLAKIDVENAKAIDQATHIQLRQQIEQSYFNMTAAYDRYKTSAEQVLAYAESFREAEVRFNNGAITSVDYLVAKNNLDTATINQVIAKYDYVLRIKILDYYRGKGW